MRQRLNGQILRGQTVYYTFQRAKTGLEYLTRAEAKGEDPNTYRVTYEYEGKMQEMPAKEFRKVGPKLAASIEKAAKAKANGSKVATLTKRGAKVRLNKQASKPSAPAKKAIKRTVRSASETQTA